MIKRFKLVAAAAALLAATGAWAALTMTVALLATWRLSQCFAIDHQCEVLETTADQAKTELDHAVTTTDAQSMLTSIYQEFSHARFQGQLAFYLPGPLEVKRRSTQLRLGRLLLG